jgi:hypothetical protein
MAGATVGDLELLQKLMVKALTRRVEEDMDDNIPTDAATLGVIAKLLKDNSITADPADADDLAQLREKLTAQSAARRRTASSVVALVKDDMRKEA